jgi:hypothetical protein
LAEIVATWRIPSLSLTGTLFDLMFSTVFTTAASIPRLISTGFAPEEMFFIPSVRMAWARSVAVVVPSPVVSWVFWATSFTSFAPIFSNLSWSEISFAIVTPSFVTTGFISLSIATYLPLGPSVILTVSATLLTPARSDRRASS